MPDSLALKFADLDAPSISTIDAHLKVIQEDGATWWGWWKKDSEAFEGFARLLREFGSARTAVCWLVAQIWLNKHIRPSSTWIARRPSCPRAITAFKRAFKIATIRKSGVVIVNVHCHSDPELLKV